MVLAGNCHFYRLPYVTSMVDIVHMCAVLITEIDSTYRIFSFRCRLSLGIAATATDMSDCISPCGDTARNGNTAADRPTGRVRCEMHRIERGESWSSDRSSVRLGMRVRCVRLLLSDSVLIRREWR